jgi:H+-translocating NAD(P) transhydrogenase subunit alpha
VKWDDEIIKATVLTRDGAVVYSLFKPKIPETDGAT